MHFDSERIAERKVEEARQEGLFDNLPGKGKPLELDDTPTHLRILKNAGVPPDWVQMDREIDRGRAECARIWARLEKEYPRRRAKAEASGAAESAGAARDLFTEWLGRVRASYLRALKQVNTEILRFNLTAPSIARTHLPILIAEETERFDQAFPALKDTEPAADCAAEASSSSRGRLGWLARQRYRYDSGSVRGNRTRK